jgi:hypothetical protein
MKFSSSRMRATRETAIPGLTSDFRRTEAKTREDEVRQDLIVPINGPEAAWCQNSSCADRLVVSSQIWTRQTKAVLRQGQCVLTVCRSIHLKTEIVWGSHLIAKDGRDSLATADPRGRRRVLSSRQRAHGCECAPLPEPLRSVAAEPKGSIAPVLVGPRSIQWLSHTFR